MNDNLRKQVKLFILTYFIGYMFKHSHAHRRLHSSWKNAFRDTIESHFPNLFSILIPINLPQTASILNIPVCKPCQFDLNEKIDTP